LFRQDLLVTKESLLRRYYAIRAGDRRKIDDLIEEAAQALATAAKGGVGRPSCPPHLVDSAKKCEVCGAQT
jgi:hypothetical protein